jgi:tetratricopeptide (TPR) repeat protein
MRFRRGPLTALLLALGLACAEKPAALSRDRGAAWQEAFDAGSAAYAAGNADEAEVKLRTALEIAQAEQPPGLRTALCLNGLAAIAIDRRRFGEAEPSLQRAIELFEAGGASSTLHYAAALTNAGELALRSGRSAEAELRFSRAVDIAGASPQPAAIGILQRSLAGQAAALRSEGRDAEAQALSARLTQLCNRSPSPVCDSLR